MLARRFQALAVCGLGVLALAGPARAQSCSPDQLFGPPLLIDAGGPLRSVATADLNQDGVPDLLLSADSLEIRLGSRAGGELSFGPARRYAVDPRPTGVAIADLDGDGLLDVLVACDTRGVIVFHGLGDGTLRRVRRITLGPTWNVASIDVNADGIPDMVTSGGYTKLNVLLGTDLDGVPTGIFGFPIDSPSIGQTKGFALADLDGDGIVDLAAANSGEQLTLHLGNPTRSPYLGSFQGPIAVVGASGPTHDVTIADFNGDGRLDLASADSSARVVTVYLQGAGFTFTDLHTHTVDGDVVSVNAVDVNHDGRADLLVGIDHGAHAFELLMNEGEHSLFADHLGVPYAFGPGRSAAMLAVADLDGDGTPDVLAPSPDRSELAVYLNQCPRDRLSLGVSVVGHGSVVRVPDRPAYAPGDSVSLVARPDPTYFFRTWDGDATGGASTTTVVMDGSRFVTATFPEILHELRVRVVGAGTVERTPAGAQIHEGTSVRLVAHPGPGTFFAGWSGDTLESAAAIDVALFHDRAVTATFQPEAGVAPLIQSITDTPLDQGGHVKLRWRASSFEFVPQDSAASVVDYLVWRAEPSRLRAARAGASAPRLGPTAYDWRLVATVPTTGSDTYELDVASVGDSSAFGRPWTVFLLEGHDPTRNLTWASPPDSGYSVDNLAPARPAAFLAEFAGGSAQLRWRANTDSDLHEYRLYRGTDPDFVPGASSGIAATNDTSYVDASPAGSFYKLAAVDVHGNASEYAFAALEGQAFALAGTSPSPSVDGRCVVSFVLPSPAPARLELLDITGRRVLGRDFRLSGRQTVDLAPGRRVTPGLYWLRLTQGTNERVARAVILR